MNQLSLGIIREEKTPPDHRVAIIPEHCAKLLSSYPNLSIYVQPSSARCFSENEYKQAGCIISEDLQNCDILLGVKEVPKSALIPNKKYLFFSHTIKKQPHNQSLLKRILELNIELIDYETIVFDNKKRVVAFGHFAGIVGAHNGLLAWGKRTSTFTLKPAHLCEDYAEMRSLYTGLTIPPIKIAVTGTGRVGAGATELLDVAGCKLVPVFEFLQKEFDYPVYCVLRSQDMFKRKDGKDWDTNHFHNNPSEYESKFLKYSKVTDLLINTIYWNPSSPRLFELDDMKRTDFNIKSIADISCDIDGSVPATFKSTTIADPVFGYNPKSGVECNPYTEESIDIMAVDNLPCEMPKDASHEFSHNMISYVMPQLFETPNSAFLQRATIAKNGILTNYFSYLTDYVEGV